MLKNRFVAKEKSFYKIEVVIIQPFGGGEFNEDEGAI